MFLSRLPHQHLPDLQAWQQGCVWRKKTDREVPPSRPSPGSQRTLLGPSGALGASGTSSAEGRALAGDRLSSAEVGRASKRRKSRHRFKRVNAQLTLTRTVLPLKSAFGAGEDERAEMAHLSPGSASACTWQGRHRSGRALRIPWHQNEPCTTGGKRYHSSPSKRFQASLNTSPAEETDFLFPG